MNSMNNIQSQLEMSRNFHDVKGIDNLRRAAQSGDQNALKEAAKQFEAIFVQMMLKSMRKATDALADENNPFNSQQVKFYRDMHDQQLAVDMSTNGNMGLADLIVQQFSPGQNGFMPGSAVRNDGNLQQINAAGASGKNTRTGQDEAVKPPSKQAAFQSPADFIQKLLPFAEKVAQELGINPKALVAQAAVETGWGKYMIHSGAGQNSHNLFGIKAGKDWQGEKHSIDTLEYKSGIAKPQKAAFRAYESFADSLQDYVSFVKNNPRYRGAIEQAENPQAYFAELQRAGYATDPKYADKIMSVMQSPTLNQGAVDGE